MSSGVVKLVVYRWAVGVVVVVSTLAFLWARSLSAFSMSLRVSGLQ